ncbi:GRAM domain-containing protein [Cymbomonas tetramitiformis]|uniref:GRAM domain-containing protein n=1 Tax=Cymbomonas tetramitiformis TaxID=36881 RepID=A0AAE0BQN6_9CHLO|nr:GRAM domain-containing protein [Cymbomonas tetramitiformis]
MKTFQLDREFDISASKLFDVAIQPGNFFCEYQAILGNSDVRVSEWTPSNEAGKEDTLTRVAEYTVSLKLPAAVKSALGNVGAMRIIETMRCTAAAADGSRKITTLLQLTSPETAMINFKQESTWSLDAAAGGSVVGIAAELEVLAGAPWGLKGSLEGLMVSENKQAMHKWFQLAAERASERTSPIPRPPPVRVPKTVLPSAAAGTAAVATPSPLVGRTRGAALLEAAQATPQKKRVTGEAVPRPLEGGGAAAEARRGRPAAPHPFSQGCNAMHCATALHGLAVFVLGPLLMKENAVDFLPFVKLVLLSFAGFTLAAFLLVEFSRRVDASTLGALPPHDSTAEVGHAELTPQQHQALARRRTSFTATTASELLASTPRSEGRGLLSPRRAEAFEDDAAISEPEEPQPPIATELLGLISSEVQLLGLQLKGHAAESGLIRLQAIVSDLIANNTAANNPRTPTPQSAESRGLEGAADAPGSDAAADQAPTAPSGEVDSRGRASSGGEQRTGPRKADEEGGCSLQPAPERPSSTAESPSARTSSPALEETSSGKVGSQERDGYSDSTELNVTKSEDMKSMSPGPGQSPAIHRGQSAEVAETYANSAAVAELKRSELERRHSGASTFATPEACRNVNAESAPTSAILPSQMRLRKRSLDIGAVFGSSYGPECSSLSEGDLGVAVPSALHLSAAEAMDSHVFVRVKLTVGAAESRPDACDEFWGPTGFSEEPSVSVKLVVSEVTPQKVNAATAFFEGSWSAAGHFGLPDTEKVVQSFSAMNSKLVHGYLSITQRFICFDTVLFAGGPNKVVMPIETIRRLKRTKFAQIFNNAIELEMPTQTVYFSGLLRRQDCVDCIRTQSQLLGHELVVK